MATAQVMGNLDITIESTSSAVNFLPLQKLTSSRWICSSVGTGKRSSTAAGYLRQAESRPNLHVEVNAQAKRILFEGVAFAPYAIEHLLAGKDPAWRLEKLLQDFELFRSQFDHTPADRHLVPIQIHTDVSHAIIGMGLNARRATPQDGPHPRDQLTGALVTDHEIDFAIIILDTIVVAARLDRGFHGDDHHIGKRAEMTQMFSGSALPVDDDERRHE